MKRLAFVLLVAACSKGDECEQFADKMAPAIAPMVKGSKLTPEQFRDQTIDQCRKNPKFKDDPVFKCVMGGQASAADCLAKDMKEYMAGAVPSEAKLQLRRLASAAKVAAVVNSQFPIGTAKLLPPGTCCAHESDHECVPVGDWAADPVWKALDFEILEATAFKYTYVGAPDGKTFHATAVGDPDCDGTPETYAIDGSIDAEGVAHTTQPAKAN